jgi:hypothetical protein
LFAAQQGEKGGTDRSSSASQPPDPPSLFTELSGKLGKQQLGVPSASASAPTQPTKSKMPEHASMGRPVMKRGGRRPPTRKRPSVLSETSVV